MFTRDIGPSDVRTGFILLHSLQMTSGIQAYYAAATLIISIEVFPKDLSGTVCYY